MGYEIEWRTWVVYVRFFGLVTARELADAVSEIAADPAFELQRFHVIDYSDATLPPLDRSVFNAMVPVIGATTTNDEIVSILVPDNEQTRAFANFCKPSLQGLRSTKFFRDRDAAENWITEQTRKP